jgi:hypothetical protein
MRTHPTFVLVRERDRYLLFRRRSFAGKRFRPKAELLNPREKEVAAAGVEADRTRGTGS